MVSVSDEELGRARRARKEVKRWKEDPAYFVRSQFGVEPDKWQLKVLNAFPTNRQIAMKACKGPGKTCVLAWLVWNFLATRHGAKVACTSISKDNLMDCLWTEMAIWQAKSPFLLNAFTHGKTRIEHNENPKTWWCSARTWSQSANKEQQANTLAGLHGEHMLFVIDECGAVPASVAVAAEAGMSTGGDTRLLLAGNPTELSGPLYDACTIDADNYYVVEISGDPLDPMRSPRIDIAWAENQIRKYGRDNPWVMVNVLGKFPPSAINALLGPDHVTEAMDRHLREDEYSFAAKVIGVDVARMGDDRTVITFRQGLAVKRPVILRNALTEVIAGRVAEMVFKEQADAVMVDGTGGWGSGVIDALRLLGIPVYEVHSSGKPIDDRYYNLRAEMHFKMAEAVKGGLALPNMNEYKRELVAPEYFFHNDKMQLTDKEQIKDKIGESPDVADSLALTYAVVVKPRLVPLSPLDRAAESRARSRATGSSDGYDPLHSVNNLRRAA